MLQKSRVQYEMSSPLELAMYVCSKLGTPLWLSLLEQEPQKRCRKGWQVPPNTAVTFDVRLLEASVQREPVERDVG